LFSEIKELTHRRFRFIGNSSQTIEIKEIITDSFCNIVVLNPKMCFVFSIVFFYCVLLLCSSIVFFYCVLLLCSSIVFYVWLSFLYFLLYHFEVMYFVSIVFFYCVLLCSIVVIFFCFEFFCGSVFIGWLVNCVPCSAFRVNESKLVKWLLS